MGIINTTDIHDFVDEFESDHEEMLALIEKHKDEEGFTEGILGLCGVDRSEYDEYLSKKEACEDLPRNETLIPDSEWVEYVQEMLDETGEVKVPHYVVVDWDATADNVQEDYRNVDIEGVTYWYRE